MSEKIEETLEFVRSVLNEEGDMEKEESESEEEEMDSDDEESSEDEPEFDDFNDLWEEFKKMGYKDEEKLREMYNKALEIARKNDRSTDKEAVAGILQSFLEA